MKTAVGRSSRIFSGKADIPRLHAGAVGRKIEFINFPHQSYFAGGIPQKFQQTFNGSPGTADLRSAGKYRSAFAGNRPANRHEQRILLKSYFPAENGHPPREIPQLPAEKRRMLNFNACSPTTYGKQGIFVNTLRLALYSEANITYHASVMPAKSCLPEACFSGNLRKRYTFYT